MDDQKIQHVCNQQHNLHLIKDSEINITDQISCQLCKSSVKQSPYYVCDSCKYYIHKSCEELPKQIDHSFHPRHPLILTSRSVWCESCFKTPQKRLMFCCKECGFDMDIECALMSNSITTCLNESQHCIQHSSHPHLLLLVYTTDTIYKDVNVRCFACQSTSDVSGVYYGCNRCKYFLHKHCIDQLPQKIQTSHQPNHNHLSLHMKRYNCKCNTCGYSTKPALYFECPQCDYQLCLECGMTRRAITYEDHPHILSFLEKNIQCDRCNVYDTCLKQSVNMSNSNEFHKTHSSIFRCLDCDFKLHLLCGPLPSAIKHESHIHCLNLIDSCIEDTFGDYYCDICEEKRNPRVRVYYCAECKYVAHVHCVLSEIIKVLKGDLRDVKLKTLGSDLFYNSADDQHTIQATSSLFTFREFIRKLPVNDLRILKGQFYWDDNDDDEEDMMSKREDAHDEIIVIEELIKYSTLAKHDFVEFIFKEFHSRYSKKKLKLKGSDLALKIVDVEGYSMPLNLISAMKDLFHKHGDISTQSSYSKEFKSICFYLICKVVKEMHTTLVTDITKHLLQQWYHYIHFVKDFTYFEVGFVWECLKKITGDFYYQQMNKLLCTDVPTILKKRIDELQKNISEYQRLCESSSTEESMKEGLEEAMYSKWKLASQIGF